LNSVLFIGHKHKKQQLKNSEQATAGNNEVHFALIVRPKSQIKQHN